MKIKWYVLDSGRLRENPGLMILTTEDMTKTAIQKRYKPIIISQNEGCPEIRF